MKSVRFDGDAQVAQLVEQWTENPRVGGSSPPLGTTLFPQISWVLPFVWETVSCLFGYDWAILTVK